MTFYYPVLFPMHLVFFPFQKLFSKSWCYILQVEVPTPPQHLYSIISQIMSMSNLIMTIICFGGLTSSQYFKAMTFLALLRGFVCDTNGELTTLVNPI